VEFYFVYRLNGEAKDNYSPIYVVTFGGAPCAVNVGGISGAHCGTVNAGRIRGI